MTEKLGIIAGVVAFLGFSLFCAWHHSTQSTAHHSAEAPASATVEIPMTATAIIPQSTAPVADQPATSPPSGSTPPSVHETPQPTQPSLSSLPTTQTNQNRPPQLTPTLRSKVVEFYADSDILSPKGREVLDAILPILRNMPMTHLEIAGHTDNLGAKDYNLALSQRRADAVKNYLIAQGVAERSLVAQGYGSSLPIADNATEEGRQRNRRTEVIVHPSVSGN